MIVQDRALERNDRLGRLVERHPCYSPEAHGRYGRIHLPVSYGCNIRCRFCKREFNDRDERPGVSRGILSPDDAVRVVGRAIELCPELTVVGVAGPGESLASDHALRALELVHRAYPELTGCLSTNGLLLDGNVERIVAAGVATVSVTVNAVDSRILERICAGIVQDGRLITGTPAADRLISAQLRGIRRAVDAGLTVKVNAVLIPGVNDMHMSAIAKAVAGCGARMMNVIPLIPQHELADLPAPDCRALGAARAAVEKHLPAFRHCRHCRADACGIPGGADVADKLYDRRVETFSHG